MSWQPIETAPKDGTEVLVFGCDEQNVGYYTQRDGGEWICGGCTTCWPTHWMPLPEAPSRVVKTKETTGKLKDVDVRAAVRKVIANREPPDEQETITEITIKDLDDFMKDHLENEMDLSPPYWLESRLDE